MPPGPWYGLHLLVCASIFPKSNVLLTAENSLTPLHSNQGCDRSQHESLISNILVYPLADSGVYPLIYMYLKRNLKFHVTDHDR
jgi:hypothetical protein